MLKLRDVRKLQQTSRMHIFLESPDGTVTNLSHYMGCISPANAELNKLIEKLPKLIGIEDLVS